MRAESSEVAARVRELLGDHVGAGGGAGSADVLPLPGRARGAWQRLVGRVTSRAHVRIDPGRRTALAVGVAVLIAAIVTGAWVAAAKPRSMPVSARVPSLSATPVGSAGPGAPSAATGKGTAAGSSSAGASPDAPASGGGAELIVDVAGKVHRPGLYHLPTGSRIDDAVRAAGGPLHGIDLDNLNLAARVVDGQQILVGATAPAAGSGSGAPAAAAGATGGPVDLNTATLEQLQTLPGVGPVLAQHILDYRTQHGSFTTVDQLNDVSGIGDVKFADLHSLVTV